MTDTEGWTAFFVKEEGGVSIYDIYDASDEWRAQCRFNRRKGTDVYVLFARYEADDHPLKKITSRDAWRAWLQDHQCNL